MISSIITAVKLTDTIVSYCIKKGLDVLTETKSVGFKDRLKKVIDETIDEYMRLHPIPDYLGKYAFYKSQKVVDELLKYRIMSQDYNISDLETAFNDETNVISPDKEDVENFCNIFIGKIEADEILRQLEISSTSNAEVFKISKKLDRVINNLDSAINNIDSAINNIHNQLDSEWQRQINVYKENIYNFKPKTALNLLIELEFSFDLSQKKPTNALKATMEFLKGQCHELTGNYVEMHKCYLKAYRLDSNPITFKEKACYAFAMTDKPEEAQKVTTEILQFDEYNVIAWAVNILISNNHNLMTDLEMVPSVVIEDINFKRIIYFNTRTKFEVEHLNMVYDKYLILPEIELSDKSKLTFKNYKSKIFLIEATISKIFQSIYFDFKMAFNGDILLIKSIKPIIEDLLTELDGTEIFGDFKPIIFINDYFEYVLNGEKDSVIKMKLSYDNLPHKDNIQVMLIANCLQQINEVDSAIITINKHLDKSLEMLYLESFCYLKKNDFENYIGCSHEILNKTDNIDLNSIENILNIAYTLNAFGKADSIIIEEFVQNKEFEFDYLKILIEAAVSILTKQNDPEVKKKLQKIEIDLLSSKSKIIFHVAYLYFLLNDYDPAINLFRKFLDKKNESRDLFIYIRCLDKASIYNKELLYLLRLWRENFSFNEDLLRLEADLYRQLSDWESCINVCDCFLARYENEESFLTLYLISINELDRNDKPQVIEEIANIFSTFDFKVYSHAKIACDILLQNQYHKVVLDILYRHAIIKENKQARTDYFFACTNIPYELIKEKDTVDLGSFVKFRINQEINFVEIKDSDPLSKFLLGHNVGEIVKVHNPMFSSFDSIEILRIMDKYLCLHDEILEEVKKNPFSGMPIQSVEFKDTTPEGLINTLVSLMGANGTLIKKNHENAILKYYNYEISFSEIIFQNYNSDYIGGYFNLIHYHEGFTIIPATFYPRIEIAQYENFVIDFSSLLILFQVCKEHEVSFEHKFIISKGIVDYIKAYKKQESSNIRNQLSIDVSLDGVTKSTKPEEIFKSNIQYLSNLIEWIEKFCITKIAESRLNITRRLDIEIKNELFANYITDNMSLLMEHDNSLFITDDSIHLKFFPLETGRICSSEIFIVSCFGSSISIISELIKNKYVGMTISKDILVLEFNKKLKEQINYYNHCLNNLSLVLNPSRQSVFTIIQFLKEIANSSLLLDDSLRREATNAFVILLKGQTGLKVFRITELLIEREFILLGTKLDLIRASFQDAVKILEVSNQ